MLKDNNTPVNISGFCVVFGVVKGRGNIDIKLPTNHTFITSGRCIFLQFKKHQIERLKKFGAPMDDLFYLSMLEFSILSLS